MLTLDSARTFFKYSDWANDIVLRAAGPLADANLDKPFAMGRGSLRMELLHVWAGEHVWLQRWQGGTETPWPNEEERVAIPGIAERFAAAWRERDTFLATLADRDLARAITYRDSKGSLFSATLADMMTQMIVHSTHHRAQIVNMLRNVGVTPPPDLDYMYWVRKPV
ncbi:MAG: DinB family protein [Planctomycetes bacterium]|nr:DinB family protein [Planctomycetota bacterium]